MAQQQSIPPPQQYYYPTAPQQPGNRLAVAGFILGLLGFLAWFSGIFQLALVVLGIVFSAIGLKNANRGQPHKGLTVAGLTLAVVGAVVYLTIGIASHGVFLLV